MNTKILSVFGSSLLSIFLPSIAYAASADEASSIAIPSGLSFIAGVVLACIIAWLGIGALNAYLLDEEEKAAIGRKHPMLSSFRTVSGTLVVILLLFLFSFKTINGIAPFNGPNGWMSIGTILAVMAAIAVYLEIKWPRKSRLSIFAVIIGTLITFALIGFKEAIFNGGISDNPFVMSVGILFLIMGWYFLFGPWQPKAKAYVLGTFIFWVAIHIFFKESQTERTAHLLASLIALIPAVIWCLLFLSYHKQRLSMVLLMFFAGMLSTAPILLYDKILRSGIELNFFLFRIVPESFSRSSSAFVSTMDITGYSSTVTVTLVSFMVVGFIEEMSKFWVLRKSGRSVFSSIDDVIQLAIIVAIGFAFAENVLNPNYFIAFVNDYLVVPQQPDWPGFLGNFLGRSVLTNMVHIVSTGVLGYFFGLALFSRSYLDESEKRGKTARIPDILNKLFRVPEPVVFRKQMIILGSIIAIVLHGVFNFLVTLSSVMPGNPRTIGDLLHSSPDSLLHSVAILIIPSMFYVVGGFWVLSMLLSSKRVCKERGNPVQADAFVQIDEVA